MDSPSDSNHSKGSPASTIAQEPPYGSDQADIDLDLYDDDMALPTPSIRTTDPHPHARSLAFTRIFVPKTPPRHPLLHAVATRDERSLADLMAHHSPMELLQAASDHDGRTLVHYAGLSTQGVQRTVLRYVLDYRRLEMEPHIAKVQRTASAMHR